MQPHRRSPLLLAALALALVLVPGVADGPLPGASGCVRRAVAGPEAARWNEWSPATFARARREGRILVVKVSAAWCHWCHVMERETFADPRVARRIEERFLAVKVDADARPDLAERYAEYRWPATVFLTPDARTITALRGYRSPDDFLAVLDEVEAAAARGLTLIDTTPPSAAGVAGPVDLAALRARLEALLGRTWDAAQAGWGFGQKYPFAPALLHALNGARRAPAAPWRGMALRTLAAWERLIDPVWGGMYQYSEGGGWDRPHYEKIVSVNAGAISCFAAAFRLTGDRRWVRDAEAVRRWLVAMLRSPSGAFFTSQDADLGSHGDVAFVDGPSYFARDDAGRRALGLPRIDTAVYAMENGWAVEALCDLFVATGDATALAQARAAAQAILATHRDAAGGLRHAATDGGVLHLGDTVSFGRACLALADATGERAYLDRAVALGDALLARFLDRARGGFFDTTEDPTAVGVWRERLRPFEGNATAARFLLHLHAATGDARWRAEALRAIAAAGEPGLAERFAWRASFLLLPVEEATVPWAHLSVVGRADDPATAALWAAALAFDAPFVTRERLEPGAPSARGGAPLGKDGAPAIFLCADGGCSPPIRRAEDLVPAWRRLVAGR